MDIRKVKKLIEMLESSGLEVIEIQEGEESVRLVKKQTETVVSHLTQNQADPITEKTVMGHSQEALSTIKAADGEVITSPMVGTFYAEPFRGSSSGQPSSTEQPRPMVCQGDSNPFSRPFHVPFPVDSQRGRRSTCCSVGVVGRPTPGWLPLCGVQRAGRSGTFILRPALQGLDA